MVNLRALALAQVPFLGAAAAGAVEATMKVVEVKEILEEQLR